MLNILVVSSKHDYSHSQKQVCYYDIFDMFLFLPQESKCCDKEYKALSSDACDSSGVRWSALFFAINKTASCFTIVTEAAQIHNELKA